MITKTEIKYVNSLSSSASFRAEESLFVAEGARLVSEILNSRFRIETLYHTSDFDTSVVGGNPCKREVVNRATIERMSALKSAPSVIALVRIPDPEDHYRWGDDTTANHQTQGLTLVLDRIQDPGNMGTIIRLADWFGIKDVLCSEDSADCFSSKVIQATMGAITRVRVTYTDLKEMLSKAEKPIYGTFLNGQNIYTKQIEPWSGYIVLGNEGGGISEPIEALVNERLFIPAAAEGGTVESLNVAIAAAITCSEFARRRVINNIDDAR